MVLKRKLSEKIFDASNYIFLFLLIFATAYPFLYVFIGSISNVKAATINTGAQFSPRSGFSLIAYGRVFQNPLIVRSYLNSLVYVIAGTIVSVTLTSLGAYVLSRKNLYWRNFLMFFVLISMYFNGGLVPFYLLVNKMHMFNTIWAIILPGAISTYYLIIMRTNFKEIPVEMEESAKIDGANHFIILFRIIIPIALPIIAVMILFYGVEMWNSWFYPSLFMTHNELYPLQLVLRQILILNDSASMMTKAQDLGVERKYEAEAIKYAVIIISIIPIVCIYPFLQKYFIKGMMIGSIKG